MRVMSGSIRRATAAVPRLRHTVPCSTVKDALITPALSDQHCIRAAIASDPPHTDVCAARFEPRGGTSGMPNVQTLRCGPIRPCQGNSPSGAAMAKHMAAAKRSNSPARQLQR